MKSTTLLASLLASVALAQPHGHGHGHQHRRSHHDRQAKRGVVTWVTETVYETVTAVVDDSTTELIMPSTKDTPTPSKSSTSSPSETASPGRFLEESKTKKSSSSSSAEPTTSQAPPPPVVESPPPPPPAETTSSAAPPVNVNVGSGSGSSSGSSSDSGSDSGSSSGTDTGSDSGSGSGSSSGGSETYTGDLTYFALGLGACGFDDSGKDHSENIVAVSSQLMGSQSNGNPFCDKTITVRAGSKTIQATVRDKCPSCAPGDIDGSEKMFLDLFGSLEAGRTKIDWWFN